MFTFVIWCIGLYCVGQILKFFVEMFTPISSPAKKQLRKLRDERNTRESVPTF